MTAEQNIRQIVECSIREWLKDETNIGPLEPANTTLDHKLSYRIHDCIRDAFRKRFPNKGLFYKLRKELADHCFMADDKERRLYSADRDAFNIVADTLVDDILNTLNLDNMNTEDDTCKPQSVSMKLDVWVNNAFDEYGIRNALRRWIGHGRDFPRLGFRFVDWPDGFDVRMTAHTAEGRLAESVPERESVLKAIEHEHHARSLVYGQAVSVDDAVEHIIGELTEKIRSVFDGIRGEVRNMQTVPKPDTKTCESNGKRGFCITETYIHTGFSLPSGLTVYGRPITGNDIHSIRQVVVYGRTSAECIHNYRTETTIENRDGLLDRIVEDLKTKGCSSIPHNKGQIVIEITENTNQKKYMVTLERQ